MREMVRVSQNRVQSITDFINRVRLLVLAAHRSVKKKEREKILISNFIQGLYDNSLALQISTMSPTSAAEAERMATPRDTL